MLSYRLRHRIEFQSRSQTQDPITGELVTGWATATLNDKLLDSVPAEVLTGAGREFIASDARQAETSARINTRWFPADVHQLYQWRILWDGRVYNIMSVETDRTGRQEWRFRCKDGVNEG